MTKKIIKKGEANGKGKFTQISTPSTGKPNSISKTDLPTATAALRAIALGTNASSALMAAALGTNASSALRAAALGTNASSALRAVALNYKERPHYGGEKSQSSVNIRSALDLGLEVRRVRKKMGMTQQRFADLAGVGRRFISELESGKPTLEFNRVMKVCQAAGIDVLASSRESKT